MKNVVQDQGELLPQGRTFALAISRPWLTFSLLLLIIGAEATTLLLKASRSPFWYDELITLHVSSLQPFSLMWRALQSGADGQPPGFYGLIRAARMLPGDPHVILRLPSVLGYILILLGVYWFARKRLPPAAGLIAVVLLTLSPFREYAIEARPYPMLVGFLAISAVLWQRLDEWWLITPLLALFLTLATSCHYYAVVALLFFGIAELATSVLSHRIRWGAWIAFLIASGPFILCLPLLLHFREIFGNHFWAKPSWDNVFFPYDHFSGLSRQLAPVFVIFWGLTAAGVLRRLWRTPQEAWPTCGFRPPEILLIAGFLVYPSFLAVLTKIQGGGYYPKYGWPAILGLVLASVSFFPTSPRGMLGLTRLLGALLIVFVAQGARDLRDVFKGDPAGPRATARWSSVAEVTQIDPNIPVVIDNGLVYLEMAHYAAPSLRSRLVKVVDKEAAIHFAGSDVDNTTRVLGDFFPLRVEDSASFLAGHGRFFVYSRRDGFNWLPQYLIARKYQLKLVGEGSGGSIYAAEQ